MSETSSSTSFQSRGTSASTSTAPTPQSSISGKEYKAPEYTQPAFARTDKRDLSLAWFTEINLSPQEQAKLCFSESSFIVNDQGDPVGKAHCSVSGTELDHQKCFLVHLGSRISIEESGLECGTSVTGFVTPNLITLQEFTHQWTKFKGEVVAERKVHLLKEENFFWSMTSSEAGEIKEKCTHHVKASEKQPLVTESGNILLNRIIIFQKRVGGVTLYCLDSDGKVARNNYMHTGSWEEDVNGEKVKVWSIKRTVTSIEKNPIGIWNMLFSYHGRLVLKCQPDSDFALVPHWFEHVPKGSIDTGGNRPWLKWACDPQLKSAYLIKKDEIALEYKNYLLNHPEIRALLSDLLKAILVDKPADIFEFCSEFFQPYLKF